MSRKHASDLPAGWILVMIFAGSSPAIRDVWGTPAGTIAVSPGDRVVHAPRQPPPVVAIAKCCAISAAESALA